MLVVEADTNGTMARDGSDEVKLSKVVDYEIPDEGTSLY